jgi:hypothetical protein
MDLICSKKYDEIIMYDLNTNLFPKIKKISFGVDYSSYFSTQHI